jgi:hypothetical protein
MQYSPLDLPLGAKTGHCLACSMPKCRLHIPGTCRDIYISRGQLTHASASGRRRGRTKARARASLPQPSGRGPTRCPSAGTSGGSTTCVSFPRSWIMQNWSAPSSVYMIARGPLSVPYCGSWHFHPQSYLHTLLFPPYLGVCMLPLPLVCSARPIVPRCSANLLTFASLTLLTLLTLSLSLPSFSSLPCRPQKRSR